MVRNVIFDFGGVLIGWDPHLPYIEHFGGDKEKARWFISTICTHDWNAQLDKGKPFEEAIEEKIREFPEHEPLIRLYKEKWPETLTGQIEGTVEILSQLRSQGQHRLLGITNWSHETFPYAKQKFSFLHWFEDIVVSGEVKMIKPDKEIFDYAISRFDINPSETVFIDDNHANISTALAMGIDAIPFYSPEDLKKELVKRGVLHL